MMATRLNIDKVLEWWSEISGGSERSDSKLKQSEESDQDKSEVWVSQVPAPPHQEEGFNCFNLLLYITCIHIMHIIFFVPRPVIPNILDSTSINFLQGLKIDYSPGRRVVPTKKAHILLEYAEREGKQHEFQEHLFQAYFR